MLTINIMKLEVNTISNIGSLNIGKAIICYNRAEEISSSGDEAPPSPVVPPPPVIPPAQVIPPIP